MSRRERDTARVLERVRGKEITIRDASRILKISYRQCRRRYKRYSESGEAGLVHAGRGRSPNNKIGRDRREKILSKYRGKYSDFGPTLATEKLTGEGQGISRETLRKWLIGEGLWQRHRKRKGHRSWRQRRERFGELVQIDGSHHKWFEDRSEPCCLMNMVDDASGVGMSLLDHQETSAGAMNLLWMWIDKYGIPGALYCDRKNVYVPDEKAAEQARLRGEECLTQFGRACKQLGIEIIEAYSPQAKGRVERNHGVYQDRFVKELRLRRINDIPSANALLQSEFTDQLNRKFAVESSNKANYHRSPKGYDLKSIFCFEEERSLSDDWILRFDNKYYRILGKHRSKPAVTKVKVRMYLDGKLHISYRGKDVAFVELIELPAKPRSKQVARALRKQQPTPPADHPWRRPFKKFTVGRNPKSAR
jgi:hypothetical protein